MEADKLNMIYELQGKKKPSWYIDARGKSLTRQKFLLKLSEPQYSLFCSFLLYSQKEILLIYTALSPDFVFQRWHPSPKIKFWASIFVAALVKAQFNCTCTFPCDMIGLSCSDTTATTQSDEIVSHFPIKGKSVIKCLSKNSQCKNKKNVHLHICKHIDLHVCKSTCT